MAGQKPFALTNTGLSLEMSGNTALSKASIAIFAAGLCLLLLPGNARAYSVMAHEAIIDACWDPAIKPLLLARYPNSTPEQLAEARSYAYGGSIIQDLGYYPFGSFFFSQNHRSGIRKTIPIILPSRR